MDTSVHKKNGKTFIPTTLANVLIDFDDNLTVEELSRDKFEH